MLHSPSSRSDRLLGIALVNVATLSWATNMVLGRVLRFEIGPITLSALRFCIGAALFAALLRREAPEQRRLGKDWWLLLVMGLAGVALFGPMHYLGLRYTSVVNATLIQAIAPLTTGLLAALLIQEPISRRQALGAAVGLAGVAILISRGSLAFWETVGASIGDMVIIAAVVLWSLYTVIGRRVMVRRSPVATTGLSMMLAVPFLLAAMIWEWQALPLRLSSRLVLAIVYIGVVPSVVGFLSWNAGVRRLGPSGAMTFYNTLPLYGILPAYIFLGEHLALAHLAGGLLIVGGGLWAARAQARPGSPPQG